MAPSTALTTTFTPPSSVLSSTLPVKPSVTITSTRSVRASRPSTFPMNRPRAGSSQPGAATAPAPPHPRQGAGPRRAGVAGAHHGGHAPVAHRLGGPHHRRVALAPGGAGGVVGHLHHLGGGDDLQVAGVADGVGPADEHDRDAELLGGLARSGDDVPGAPVGTHGVDRDGQLGHASGFRSTAQSTMTACRPPYHPQFGQ